jgi:hypothetical protein
MAKTDEKYYQQMAKLPPAKQKAVLIRRAASRLDVHLRDMDGWRPDDGLGKARDNLLRVIEGMHLVADAFDNVPDTYRPRAPRKQKTKMEPGVVVRFTDKRQPEYSAVLKKRELKDLEVTKVAGPKLFVRTKTGTVIMVPRTHVTAQEA